MSDKEYKVVFMPILGSDAVYTELFKTSEEAEAALKAISAYTIKLHKWELMNDYGNFGAVYKLINDEWVEIDAEAIDDTCPEFQACTCFNSDALEEDHF